MALTLFTLLCCNAKLVCGYGAHDVIVCDENVLSSE